MKIIENIFFRISVIHFCIGHLSRSFASDYNAKYRCLNWVRTSPNVMTIYWGICHRILYKELKYFKTMMWNILKTNFQLDFRIFHFYTSNHNMKELLYWEFLSSNESLLYNLYFEIQCLIHSNSFPDRIWFTIHSIFHFAAIRSFNNHKCPYATFNLWLLWFNYLIQILSFLI